MLDSRSASCSQFYTRVSERATFKMACAMNSTLNTATVDMVQEVPPSFCDTNVGGLLLYKDQPMDLKDSTSAKTSMAIFLNQDTG